MELCPPLDVKCMTRDCHIIISGGYWSPTAKCQYFCCNSRQPTILSVGTTESGSQLYCCIGWEQVLQIGRASGAWFRSLDMAQGSFKKSAGAPKVKGKAGKGNVAAKSRLVNKGKTAVKKGGEWWHGVGGKATYDMYNSLPVRTSWLQRPPELYAFRLLRFVFFRVGKRSFVTGNRIVIVNRKNRIRVFAQDPILI